VHEQTFTPKGDGIATRWPHLKRFLYVNNSDVCVDDYPGWHFAVERNAPPKAELAAAYDEWADYYAWCLTQRTDLADDRIKRHIVEGWSDSMVYCCQRSAARVRGEELGEWLPQHERRPDLAAEGKAIMAELTVP